MPVDVSKIQAILFDYGNTLIQFAQPQIDACNAALLAGLESFYGPVDCEKFAAIRYEDRMGPFGNGYRENSLSGMTVNLVQALFDREPAGKEVEQLVRARFDAMVKAITAPAYIYDLLDTLRKSFTLALVSNYPDGDAIRMSLQTLGLTKYFKCVVVSADVERIKPHPLPFTTCLEMLGIRPENAVYVGDNWLADIQGAKRLGMYAIHTTQYEGAERFQPQPGDFEPDAVIEHITDLLSLARTKAAER